MMGAYIDRALDVLLSQQLVTGEMVSHRRVQGGDSFYAPCPMVSALVHSVLGDAARGRLARHPMLATLRWRLRCYLAWEQESDASWRLHGRDGWSPPDAATTACAATVLLTESPADRTRELELLSRLPCQPLGAAHTLRFHGLAGGDTSRWLLRVREQLLERDDSGTVAFLHATAWALRTTGINAGLHSLLIERLMRQRQGNCFGNRLEHAMCVSALLDCGYDGELLLKSSAEVLSDPIPMEHWPHDAYTAAGGSASLTIALTIANLVRTPGLRNVS